MSLDFTTFCQTFLPQIEKKFLQVNLATWILETKSSTDAADLKASLDAELKILLSDPQIYEKLREYEKKKIVSEPLLKRQLNVLIRHFEQNQIDANLLEEISKKEAALTQAYSQFRGDVLGEKVSENDIRKVLKAEKDIEKRKLYWEASKQIGKTLAPLILELVDLRNTAAKKLGYSDYFSMQLSLQEVDKTQLLQIFSTLAEKSDKAYSQMLSEVESYLADKFKCHKNDLGPWSWSEPFGQEDPVESIELDFIVKDVDIVAQTTAFYDHMGFDVRPILEKSDMYERADKCPHAFCISIDRKSDVRTLNNVTESMKWLETVLHEYGHAIYDVSIDRSLPFILREPPHMITTEAMALLAGRQAYLPQTLELLVGKEKNQNHLFAKAEKSLKRRQLIFSRFVMVMTEFESSMYENPKQDLNQLWWDLVEKYQKIKRPKNRDLCHDFACKYHIGLAPVYYFSYLLGELFASSIQKTIKTKFGINHIASLEAGLFLKETLFHPGNCFSWDELVIRVTGKELTFADWLEEFS